MAIKIIQKQGAENLEEAEVYILSNFLFLQRT